MKKSNALPFLAGAMLISFSMQAQELDWAGSFVPTTGNNVSGSTVDAAGNMYTTGYFGGTVDFDPGPGTFNLTTAGNYDLYITKLDASGNLVWAKSIGGANNDYGNAIAVDGSGNVLITGSFPSTVDFDPGPGTFNMTSAGGEDVFILKLDALGNFVWAKRMGGSTSHDAGHDIAVSASGSVYTTGHFYGTADFDPGAGVYYLNAAGSADIFVSKLDASGNFVWADRMGGSNTSYGDAGNSIVLDAAENVYTTGIFYGTGDFDPGTGTVNLVSAGDYDVFYSKLDAAGNYVWAKRIGGTGYDESNCLAIDASGNLYSTGLYSGTVDFDPGAGVVNRTSAGGSSDIFVNKLDASCNYVWANSMGSTDNNERGFGVAADATGNVYSTGVFWGTADFDPGTGVSNLVSAGYGDIFISKFDVSGNYVWAYSFGSSPQFTGAGKAIDISTSGSIYITGFFQGTADFEPGPGTTSLTSPTGYSAVFVERLNQCTSVTRTENITACPPFTWRDGNTYTTSQTGIHYTVDGAVIGGCDSTYVLNLTITPNTVSLSSLSQTDNSCFGSSDGVAVVNPATGGSGNYTYDWTPGAPNGDGTTSVNNLTSGTWTCTATDDNGCTATQSFSITEPPAITGSFTQTSCDSYNWNSQVYSASGTYTQTLAAVNGCDSTVTLNLTITNSSSGIEIVSACDSYTWIDGNTYTASNNTATYILTNTAGCDSTITLNLTINNAPAMTATDNGSGTITASAAASYQWINCTTNTPIAGATSGSYSPAVNGTYAVIGYSAAMCADTSDCVPITYLSVAETQEILWNIVPNPASSQVTITFNANFSELIIRDMQGNVVSAKRIHSGEAISLEEFGAGVYFFELISAEGKSVKRVMKM